MKINFGTVILIISGLCFFASDIYSYSCSSPSKPTGLTASAASSSQINLSWSDVSGESSYKIYRDGQYLTSVGANVTNYHNTGLQLGTTYCYRVRAHNSCGDSSPSEQACATTINPNPDTTPPTPNPMTWSSVPAATGTTTIAMTATTAIDGDSPPVEYNFECANDGSKSSSWQTSPTYVATGLDEGALYSFRVKARDSTAIPNETGWSSTQSATTDNPPDTTPPTPDPMTWFSVPAAIGPNTITMTATTATDSQSPPVQYYFECTNDGNKSSGWQSSEIYIATGLTPGTEYSFKVKARDSAASQNETDWSTPQSEATDAAPPAPNPMTWFSIPAATGPNTITMTATTATDNQSPPVQYYFVCTNDSSKNSGWQTSTTYEAHNLIPGIQYSFRVKARDSAVIPNQTDWSSTKSATTDATAPTPDPMTWFSVPAATGPTTIAMTATIAADSQSLPVQYYFECTNDGSKSSNWQTSTTYVATGLTPSIEYSFRIKARDNAVIANVTGWSNTQSAAIDATAPTPDPMTWSSVPAATGPTTIAMTATTATDSNSPPVQYYFECINDSSKSSNWQSSTEYTALYLTSGTQYSFRVKARDSACIPNETGWSSGESAVTFDNNAPVPNPATWSSDPAAISETQITMTATTGIDNQSPPVQYYFECTNDGSKSSSWQTSTEYTASDLTPGAQYSFKVKTRDSADPPNESGWSSGKPATTPDQLPGPVSLQEPTIGSWSVQLSWTYNDKPSDFDHYNVYRAVNSGGPYLLVANDVINETYIDYVPSTDAQTKTYFYVVTAVDVGSNESSYSSERSAALIYYVRNLDRNIWYVTIQASINDALDNETIQASSGMTYTENIQFTNKKVTLTSAEPNNPALTIIDGGGSDSVVSLSSGDAASVIMGLTITNGSADKGGGICCNGASPTITGCVVSGNNASNNGGGLYINGGSVTLIDTVFKDNHANNGKGGAIYGDSSAGIYIKDCTFGQVSHGNTATLGGGALSGCSGYIHNSIIAHNSGGGGAGAISNSTVTILNSVIMQNTGCDTTGLAAALDNCDGDVINSTIVDNTGGTGSSGLANCNGQIKNCIIWGNGDGATDQFITCSTPTYSCIQDCSAAGSNGNIDSNPSFDTDGYHLIANSPCIDTGEPNYLPEDSETDIDSDRRLRATAVDIGAHEYGKIIYVDIKIETSGNGQSWDTAYKYLQDAINSTVTQLEAGDEIWVAAGIYYPDQYASIPAGTDDRDETFLLVEKVALYGGFGGIGPNETSLDRRNWTQHQTILSGDIDGEGGGDNGFPESRNSFHVVKGADHATIDGFIITHGYAGDSTYGGGGMLNEGAEGLVVADCIIQINLAGDSRHGGGIHNRDNSGIILINCVLNGNRANGYGGAIYNDTGKLELINCTITANLATDTGGVHSVNSNALLIENCTIWGNEEDNGSEGEDAQLYATGGNTPEVKYSCITDWSGGGTGNIGTDPCFVSSGYWDASIAPDSKVVETVVRDFIVSDVEKTAYPDFNKHQDFEYDLSSYNVIEGIVGPFGSSLGMDRKPDYDESTTHISTHTAADFNRWYRDTAYWNMSMPIFLELKHIGGNIYEFRDEWFFPIDEYLFGTFQGEDFHYSNPNYDGDGYYHNFHFTLELHTTFTYHAEQEYLRIYKSDDDLFVYIDGKLVVDIGGIHPPQARFLKIDNGDAFFYNADANGDPTTLIEGPIDLNLQSGQTYDFDLFYAERHTEQSHFEFSTTFDFNQNFTPGNYHLQASSPCIDAGDNNVVPSAITTDLDGVPRFIDDPDVNDTGAPLDDAPYVDMGAYEYPKNRPPSVEAGTYAPIVQPASELCLNDASVEDDGLPVPPGSVSVTWECISHPNGAVVTFDDPNELHTWVRGLTKDGTYILMLTADDNEMDANDTVAIDVTVEFNVNAGYDQTIQLPMHETYLRGLVTGGDPCATAAVTWSAQGWPAGADINDIIFDNPNLEQTRIELPQIYGNYILMLSAQKGEYSGEDKVRIELKKDLTTNYPPDVNAGEYDPVTLPAVLNLNGKITDDGRPIRTITSQWSEVIVFPPGGTVTFGDCNSLDTTAVFSLPGIYTLKLHGSDGELDANDLVDITVYRDPNKNYPPQVEAGSDYEYILTSMVNEVVLDLHDLSPEIPEVTDDGKLYAQPKIMWSVPVGDITAVSFSDPEIEIPIVTFAKPGTYVLELKAGDGEFNVTDEVQIDINLPVEYSIPDVNACFSGELECDCAPGCYKKGVITLPEIAYLHGDVSGGTAPTTRWLMARGPSPVDFGDVNDVNTTVNFHRAGQYILQLQAKDGMVTVSDDVKITVNSRNRLGGGEAHTLIIDKNKRVWSCGPNRIHCFSSGLLGTGSSSRSLEQYVLTPVNCPISGKHLDNIEIVCGGAVHSLAVDSDRNVWSWGDNTFGELGIGFTHYGDNSYFDEQFWNPVPEKVRAFELVYDPCHFPDENGFHSRLKNNENMNALHVLDNNNIIVSCTSAGFPAVIGDNNLEFYYDDLVEYNPDFVNTVDGLAPDTARMYFDGNHRGVNCNISSVYVYDDEPNVMIFSVISLKGITIDGTDYENRDLIRYDNRSDTFSLFFDGSAHGFTGKITAVHVLDNDNIVLSCSESILGGVGFKEEVLVEVEGDYLQGPIIVKPYFQQALLSDSSIGIDAVHITDNNDIIFSTDVDEDVIGELFFKARDLVKCAVNVGYLDDVLDISAGRSGRHSLAVKSDGSVWAWGLNDYGQLGIGRWSGPIWVPIPVFGYDANDSYEHEPGEGYLSNIVSVAAGVVHSLALEKLDNTNENCNGRVYAWGDSSAGALGDGYGYGSCVVPTMVVAPDFNQNLEADDGNLENIVAIAAGWATSMALEKLDPNDQNCQGRVYTCGTMVCEDTVPFSGIPCNKLLGDGENDSSKFPLLVHAGQQDPEHPDDDNYPLKNIVAVSAGQGHFMALDVNGSIWTWGFNGWCTSDFNDYPYTLVCQCGIGGQLGNGQWEDSSLPVQVVAPDRDGDGFSDDLNGDGDFSNDYLGDDIPIVSISAGYWHCLAEDQAGNIYSWGYGGKGRLGLGSEDSYNIPQVVKLNKRVHNLNKDLWYNRIRPAVDAADYGDKLVVYPGTYYESIEIANKFLTITSSDPNNWDVVSNTIISSPNDINDVIYLCTYSDLGAASTRLTVAGLTLTNGYDGIQCGSYESLIVRNCIIKDNSYYGIEASRGTTTLINNWITGNGFGGDKSAVYIANLGKPGVIRNNTVVHNQYGITASSNMDVINCIIWKNGTNDSSENILGGNVHYCAVGGGYTGGSGNFDLTDPCFVNPYDFADITTSNGTSSTIEVLDVSKYQINQVIEIGNDGIIRTITDVNVNTNIITFEPSLDFESVQYTIIHNWGVGAINLDEDWHIKPESVCKNAGDPSLDYSDEVDIDGDWREIFARVDIGADEYAPLSVYAGEDQQATIGHTLPLLDASFTEDPCGALSWLWSSIPDTNVVFSNDTALYTDVTFYGVGSYTLQLNGYKDYSDGNGPQLADSDTVVISVNPWAGENRLICWPENHVLLNDADANGAYWVKWVQLWGNANVKFVNNTNPYSLHPELELPEVGIYGLELQVMDNQGRVIGSDTVWIDVLMYMVDVNTGIYPPVKLSAEGIATLKLTGSVCGVAPHYTYWTCSDFAVFDDPYALDTKVTFTSAGDYTLELRAYDQFNRVIGAAVTWITVFGNSVVYAGEYDSIVWPANSVTLNGRIISDNVSWTEWVADTNVVTFDNRYDLKTNVTFDGPDIYQIGLVGHGRYGNDIGYDDTWITVSPVEVNASLDADSDVNEGQIIFSEVVRLYGSITNLDYVPEGITIEWSDTSGYVTFNEVSGWEHVTAEFPYPGSYYVVLSAIDVDDNKEVDWDVIHIVVTQPQGVVNAGENQIITLPNPANLHGTIRGNEPADVNYTWSVFRYTGYDPCEVSFVPNNSGNANITTATFFTRGIYDLLLSVYAGDFFFGLDTVKVIVNSDNQPPIVKTGIDKTGVVSVAVPFFDVQVWDEDLSDGDPNTNLSYLWSMTSGPNDISESQLIFDPCKSALNPGVTFSASGDYTMKLTATDSEDANGCGTVNVRIGIPSQKTTVDAGIDKTVILPRYTKHLEDARVFPILTGDMIVSWSPVPDGIPNGGYVEFLDPNSLYPCDSILNPLVNFSPTGDGCDVTTGDYTLQLKVTRGLETLTDTVKISVSQTDIYDPVITAFYATIDDHLLPIPPETANGLIFVVVEAEDENLNEVVLELTRLGTGGQTFSIPPYNTEVLKGVLDDLQKLRRTYKIHTSHIGPGSYTLTAKALDTVGHMAEEKIDFEVAAGGTIAPVARITGWEDEDASETCGFNQEPNKATIVDKGLIKLIGAVYAPNSPADVNYKIELFDDSIGDMPVECWNPNYLIYDHYLVKNITGGFIQGEIGSDENNGVLTGDLLNLTGVENGAYQILLTVEYLGVKSYANAKFILDCPLKIGNVKFSQEDLVIPAGEFPLRVVRTYDSLNKDVEGDFGYGWSYSITDMDIELNEYRLWCTSETDAAEVRDIRWGSNYDRDVTLTLPDGTRATFVFYFKAQLNEFRLTEYVAEFASPPGITATLRTEPYPQKINISGFWNSEGTTAGTVYYPENYEFPGFVLTTGDGTKYHIERTSYGYNQYWDPQDNAFYAEPYGPPYLSSITTPSGEEIRISNSKIAYRDLEGTEIRKLEIQRDGGNITKIWAPSEDKDAEEPPTLKYQYDGYGNLIKVHRLIDKKAQPAEYDTITYDYNDPCGVFGPSEHYVFDIKDDRGLTSIRYIYDANGLLNGIYDAKGNYINIDHDISDNNEVVTDRLGNVTIYHYNDRGNVISTIFADGNEITYAYDDPCNPDSPTVVTDQLGNQTIYQYDDKGRATRITDPELNITENYYENSNLIEVRQYYTPDINEPNDIVLVSRTNNTYEVSLLTETKVYDPNSTPVSWTRQIYDTKNRLTEIHQVDPTGAESNIVTVYDYNQPNSNSPDQPFSITSPGGQTTYFRYDDNGSQIESWYHWIDPNNSVNYCNVYTISEYDAAGRIIETLREVNDVGGDITTSTVVLSQTIYSSIGKVETSINEMGLATQYDYDQTGNLVETRTYDSNDEILTITQTLYDAEGQVWVTVGPYDPCDSNLPVGTETVYDKLNRVVETIRWADVAIQMQNVENAQGQVVGKASINWTCGEMLSYTRTEYDAAGRVQMTVTLDEDGYEQPTSYEYDAAGKQTAVIDPCGHDVNYVVQGSWHVIDTITKNGTHRTETQYEGSNRKKVTDALGHTTEFEYDALGRITKTIYPATAANPVTYTYIEYDGFGRKAFESQQTAESNPQNAIGETFEYDSAGRLSRIWLPEVIDPCTGQWTEPNYVYQYDIFGNMVLQRDPLGRETKFTYDYLHNQISSESPDGSKEYKGYDDLGRIYFAKDFKGQVTGFEYDSQGRLEYRKYYEDETAYDTNDPNETVQYVYDTLGRKYQVIEARGTTTYHYDIEGKIEQIDTPEGTINYEYNQITGQKTNTGTASTETQYGYDELGRLQSVELTKLNGSSVSELTTYEYTAVGSRWKMHLPNGITTTYNYDNCNRLLDVTHDKAGQLSKYEYSLKADGMRHMLKETVGEARTISYEYDNLNRLTLEDANDANNYGYTTVYYYDIVGNRTSRTVAANGQTLTTTYTYDPNTDKLLTEKHDGPVWAMEINNQRYYAYADGIQGKVFYKGKFGEISLSKAFLMGLPTPWDTYLLIAVFVLLPVTFLLPWILEALGRLLRSPPNQRVLRLGLWKRCLSVLLVYMILITPAGLQSVAQSATLYHQLDTRQWSEGNRIIKFTYDENGSITSKVVWDDKGDSDPGNDEKLEEITYIYNLQNRLEQVTKEYEDNGNTINEVTQYTYNQDGIRVKSYYYETINSGPKQNEETKLFLIDAYNHTGYAQVLEQWSDGGATPDITYTIGGDIITQADSTGIRHLLYDGHGSTRQMTDDAGQITDTFSYDAYGMMLGGNPTSAAPASTKLLYAGEIYDTSAEMYYLRARYYDPLNGRFNQMDTFPGSPQDPQSLHKYLYCHANPINSIDPGGKFIGGIVEVVNAISIRVMLFSMEYGPKIAAGVFVVTKVTAALWLATLSALILEDLGVLPHAEYVAEIAAILGIVLIAELFIISMLPASWTNPPPRRGMNHPAVRRAVTTGNRIHYDKTTDPSRYRHVGGPTQCKQKYNSGTFFKFARRGQKEPDIRWIRGPHPSTYPSSNWPAGINKADFKPDTPTGRAMKLPADTFRILYDPRTGRLKL